MQKKGQLYLLAALLIGFVLFVLVTPSNVIKQAVVESRFEAVSKNFERESARFVNDVIENDRDVGNSFVNFTVVFTSYSKTRNPDFGLVYAFIYGGVLYAGNYVREVVSFVFEGKAYAVAGCFGAVNTTVSVAGLSWSVPGVDVARLSSCQVAVPVRGSPPHVLGLSMQAAEGVVSFQVEVEEGYPEVVIVAQEDAGGARRVYSRGRFL